MSRHIVLMISTETQVVQVDEEVAMNSIAFRRQ